MSKPVLKSGREDVRALDDLFRLTDPLYEEQVIRVLRFFCAARGLRWQHIFPEAGKSA